MGGIRGQATLPLFSHCDPPDRLLKVFYEIFRRFQPDRQSNQVVSNPQRSSFLRRQTGMKGSCGPSDQRLHPPETGSNDWKFHEFKQTRSSSKAAVQLKAQDAAESVKHFAGDQKLRMTLQSGITNFGNRRLILQKPGDRGGTFILIPHTNPQGLQASVKQKAGVRIQRPQSSGRKLTGLAKVLSIKASKPFALAKSRTALRSATSRSGFVNAST